MNDMEPTKFYVYQPEPGNVEKPFGVEGHVDFGHEQQRFARREDAQKYADMLNIKLLARFLSGKSGEE